MAQKMLEEMTFDELVRFGVEKDLDAIVKGESLHSRVYALMNYAAQWRYEKSKLEAKEQK